MNFKFIRDKVKICKSYKSMKILKVKDICELELAKFMHSFQFHNNFLPENFENYFKTASNHHDHYTRSTAKNDFYSKRIRLILVEGNNVFLIVVLKFETKFQLT